MNFKVKTLSTDTHDHFVQIRTQEFEDEFKKYDIVRIIDISKDILYDKVTRD